MSHSTVKHQSVVCSPDNMRVDSTVQDLVSHIRSCLSTVSVVPEQRCEDCLANNTANIRKFAGAQSPMGGFVEVCRSQGMPTIWL